VDGFVSNLCAELPEDNGAVPTRTGEARVVGEEHHVMNRLGVAWQHLLVLSCRHIPDPHMAVHPAGYYFVSTFYYGYTHN